MSEEEIINTINKFFETIGIGNEPFFQAVKGLLDLYQKEKENNKDLWKAYLDVSNDRDNNYVEKDKVKELFYKKRGIIEREDLQELLGGENAKNE